MKCHFCGMEDLSKESKTVHLGTHECIDTAACSERVSAAEIEQLGVEVAKLRAALLETANALEVHGMFLAHYPNLDGCDSAHRALRFAVDAAREAATPKSDHVVAR